MEEKKKKKNYIGLVLVIFLIIYFALYVSSSTGYYEVKNNNNMNLTKKNMKKFEKDIYEGKNVNIEKYITYEQKDYRNLTSELGYNTSNTIQFIMNKSLKYTFGFISKLLT